jgi:sec-independent protein translocase protein TatA
MSIQPLFIGSLGMTELLIILFIIVLIVGGKKLPQLGAGLGEGIKNFKNSIKGADKLPEDKADASKEESKA